jgi:anti-sigma regulatory factor (Ser/Thr protein kinase)
VTAVIGAVVFDVGECLVDESREYGTWADWLGVPRHTFSAVFGAQLGGLADDVVTCVSELVANVHEHANSAIAELFLLWVPGAFLSAEVRDQDPRMPRRPPATNLRVPPFALIESDDDEPEIMQLAEAGRGLAVVEALCDRLWWRPDSSGGKVVRCHWRLKAPSDTARSHAGPTSRSQG